MARKSRRKCKGFIPCLCNPLDLPSVCLSCAQFDKQAKRTIKASLEKPKPLRALPGYEQFTAYDKPPPENAVESVCPICGRLFYAPKNKIYCSIFCKKKAYRLRRSERGGTNRKFPRQRCIVCGRWFRPKTSNQVTCGGPCTQKYFVKKYHRGVASNHPAVPSQTSGVSAKMETRSNCPVQHLRECVEQIKRHNPAANVSPSSLDALASMLASRLSWWRTISRPRQAVLLDIAISYGVNGLLGMTPLLVAMRAGKWEQARQILLNSRYAMHMANLGYGKFSVENARQISSGAWTVIPEYIPSEDDEDEEDDDQLWF